MTGNYRKRLAILCGISKYSRVMGGNLTPISFQIDAINKALSSSLYDGYNYTVVPYKDENFQLEDFPKIIAPYQQESPVDELLFYFSGHGTIYNGETYFVTFGATELNPGIKLTDLAHQLNSLHPSIKQIFVILDFCNSGGILQPINLAGSDRLSVLTATRKNQFAETTTQDGKSFAQYFIDGLANALHDKNGEISFGRLALYVSEQMQDSYVQSPSFFSIGNYFINKINTKFFVPYPRNPFFTGREKILSDIHTLLTNTSNASNGNIAQPQAISGLPGIGKTHTAIEYAYKYKFYYQNVFFVIADNQENIESGFIDIANILNLNEKDQKDNKIVINGVKKWLTTNKRWLFILDNLDNLKILKDYLPTYTSGHILITTRLSFTGTIANYIHLDKLSTLDGALFLLKRSKIIQRDALLESSSHQDTAKKISDEMAGLPLALDQAGAYVEETHISLEKYLELFYQMAAQLLAERGELTDDHPSVTITFKIAFEQVLNTNKAAADLIRACAFLAPDSIPEEIFTNAASELGQELASIAGNQIELNKAIKDACRFSLIHRNSTNQTLDIHRLVQLVIKNQIHNDVQRLWAKRVMLALNICFPNPEYDNWPRCNSFLPHALAAINLIENWKLDLLESSKLLHQVALYFKECGQYTQAEVLNKKALNIRKEILGSEDSSFALSLNNLAMVYMRQGREAEAEPLIKQALDIEEKVLEPNNPRIAKTLTNLAGVYLEQCKYAEAEKIVKKALIIKKQNLDPSIAITLNNLASIYLKQKKYNEAEKLYQKDLEITKRCLGIDHPSVAITLNNLAKLYLLQKNYVEAQQLYQEALNINKKALGEEHPDVAIGLRNLAECYYFQNEFKKAEPLYSQALAIVEKTLGTKHKYSAMLLEDLGDVCQCQNKINEAESSYKQAVIIWNIIPNSEFPYMVKVAEKLAMIYKSQERFTEAEPLYEKIVLITEREIDPWHPKLAWVIYNLAFVYKSQKKYNQAEPFFKRSLDILEKKFGNKHISLVDILNDLANLYKAQGKHLIASFLVKRIQKIKNKR